MNKMVDAISNNRRLLPCVALLEGEYGGRDVAMAVPCILDETGLSAVVELELNETERGAFDTSVAAVREDIGRLAALG